MFECCSLGLHRLKLTEEVTNDNFLKLGSSEVRLLDEEGADDRVVESVEEWMRSFFEARSTDKENTRLPTVKICPSVFGDSNGLDQSFQQKVWETLYREVGFGQKVSYGELAELSGSAKASRAVGTAMASNPISLVVPCHRVVTASGSPGNYAKKTKNDVKVWLLKHEGSL